ncbi:MAG: pyridoxal phosphate-dependent decarboxylase family protein [Candidatus Krumholzibacteriia bacterium]
MSRYTKQIRDIEPVSRRLEPSHEERAQITARVTGYAAEFLDKIYELPAFVAGHGEGRGLYDSPISDDPIDIATALDLIRDNVDAVALNPASGGPLGYIPGGGVYPAALGDYLADVTNRFAGIYFVGPGAVRMEHMLTRWMAKIIGYPPAAAGDLTSGGSVANLVAIVTARDAHELRGRDFETTVVYLTGQVHHSLDKALRIAGLGECVVRRIALDEKYRMRADVLQAAVEADKKAGLNPWLVIASAGTTDTGAVDPLAAIGDVAARYGLWFHVDAAYGGFFILCEEGPRILQGMERCDSIVMDPHKGLFLPYGTGAVVVRDKTHLHKAHAYQAHYMQDADEAADEYSPADHSPELTRHYRGMRMWLPLKLFGLKPFRACLEEKLLLTRHFHSEIQRVDGFEAGPLPDLSVMTYRYVPRHGDANEFNRRLVREVQQDGRVFITSTLLGDTFVLRLAVLSFRTHLDTIEQALEVLREKARLIEESA